MAVAPGRLEIRDDLCEPGPPGPGEVLVRTRASAVSPGTELRTLFDPQTAFPLEGGTGYMAAGVIEAVGDGVSSVKPGDRVACASGGPHRDLLCAAVDLISPCPPPLSWVEAACAYWVVPPYRGLLGAEPRLWDGAAVIGLGPLGLCAVQLLRGVSRRTLAIDPLASRRAAAMRLGAAEAAAPEDAAGVAERILPHGVDVVIELSGAQAGLELALRIATPHARVAVIGVQPRLSNFELFRPMQDKGITLVPLYRRGTRLSIDTVDQTAYYLERALDMVAVKRVDVASLASRVLPWREAPTMIPWLKERPDEAIAMAFTWEDA